MIVMVGGLLFLGLSAPSVGEISLAKRELATRDCPTAAAHCRKSKSEGALARSMIQEEPLYIAAHAKRPPVIQKNLAQQGLTALRNQSKQLL